jgi:uncharacterized membrane protein HdeD (DUF308 family)
MPPQSKRKYCILCCLLPYNKKKVVFWIIVLDFILAAIMALRYGDNYFATLAELTFGIVVYLGFAFIIHNCWCKSHWESQPRKKTATASCHYAENEKVIDWKKLFLGVLLLAGGLICFFTPSKNTQFRTLIITLILSVTLAPLGASFIWSALTQNKEKNKD